MKKTSPKTLLSPDKKRNCFIGAKVTEEQKIHIQKNASDTGMTVSDFVLSRCYNYKPMARLSQKEFEELQNLDDCRADIKNYTSALHGMNQNRRKEMFNQYPFMLGWLKELGVIGEKVNRFLERIQKKNRSPDGTSK